MNARRTTSYPLDPSASARPEHLGKLLIAQGWKQGSLLPALTYGAVCDPDDRATQAPYGSSVALPPRDDVPRHQLSVSFTGKLQSQLVVVSQTCDVGADPKVEWFAEAMAVQIIRDERTLAEARSSVRRFVLDEARGLVVDARVRATIDKAYLATLAPLPGAPDTQNERAFARWLAQRSVRAAHPDDFVNRVLRPIRDHLRDLRKQRDPRAGKVDLTRPRIFGPNAAAPAYAVELLFVLPTCAEEGTTERRDLTAAIASVVAELETAIAPACSRMSWLAVRLEELSAADYLDSDELPTD
jgi:hypothetical protein